VTTPMDDGIQRKLLGLVGLGVRARNAVVGVERVRDAARHNKLRIAIVAPDASRHSLDKVLPLLRARGVTVIEGPTAAALGAAVGKETAAAVGIVDSDLAAGVRRLVGAAGRVERKSGSPGARQEGSS
jgi:ribosomal protein L7Ae-like RNA K-turn-binding protein